MTPSHASADTPYLPEHADPGVAVRPERRPATSVGVLLDVLGAPTMDHYRRVYQALQVPWPGDAEIRRRYPVAGSS